MPPLPSDVLVIIMQYLDVSDLAVLCRTSKATRHLVNEFGWKDHIRLNYRAPSWSLDKVDWEPYTEVWYHSLSDRRWSQQEFVARPLCPPWRGKLQPLLAISPSRLIVGAGSNLYSYIFVPSNMERGAPQVRYECTYTLVGERERRKDVTSLVFIPDDAGLDRTLCVGFDNGIVERVVLPRLDSAHRTVRKIFMDPSFRSLIYDSPYDRSESMISAKGLVLSLTSNGIGHLFNPSTSVGKKTLSSIDLKSRGWSAYLSPNASHAAFGTSSISKALTVYSVFKDTAELASTPSAILSTSEDISHRQSAVYGICGTPPSCPWGHGGQVIVSGWYDGIVRVHDLRASARSPSIEGEPSSSPAPLKPVLSLYDPWSYEPIYAVASGGGDSSHIAAGSARHSVVAFWDVRSSHTPSHYQTPPSASTCTALSSQVARGWSVHAPGNDPSPVYSLILESSRLFGATQSRAFVYDFGPGVERSTYPDVPRTRDDGLKHRTEIGGFYVTKYPHGRGDH